MHLSENTASVLVICCWRGAENADLYIGRAEPRAKTMAYEKLRCLLKALDVKWLKFHMFTVRVTVLKATVHLEK